MKLLASLFVAKPQNILVVTVILFLLFLVMQFKKFQFFYHPKWILIASIAWGLYAFWEWMILIKTPEANIRADLLLIWPLLAIITAWALYRVFRE